MSERNYGISSTQQQQIHARIKSTHKLDTNQLKQLYELSNHHHQSSKSATSYQSPQQQAQQLHSLPSQPSVAPFDPTRYRKESLFSNASQGVLSGDAHQILSQPQQIEPKHETVQSLGDEGSSFQNTPVDPRKNKRVNFVDGTISEDFSQKPVTSGLKEIASMLSRFEGSEGRYGEDPIQQQGLSFDGADICSMQSPVKRDSGDKQCEEISITQTVYEQQTPKKLYMKPAIRPMSCARVSLQQSLCDEDMLAEMRKWESEYGVEKDLLTQIESTFKSMEDRISCLEAQFEISFNLSKKMDEKYSDLHRLLRGAAVYKVSRRNKKKAHLRIFSYSAELEAFCWKSPKDFFPDKKQVVYLKDIKEVKTHLDDTTRRLPAPFTEAQYLRIVMLDKSIPDLELICEDPMLRRTLVKVLVQLLEGIRKSRGKLKHAPSSLLDAESSELLVSKYAKDVENIRDEMIKTQALFADSTQLLRTAFFKATSSLISQEKKKRKAQEGLLETLKEDHKHNQNRKETYDTLAEENIRIKEEVSSLLYQLESQKAQSFAQTQFVLAEITRSINAVCATLPIDSVQELLSKQQHPQSSSSSSQHSDISHLLNILSASIDKIVERKAPVVSHSRGSSTLQGKHEQILAEYQKLLKEKKGLLDSNERVMHELNMCKMQRDEMETNNSALTTHVQSLLEQISAKEDHFNCVVEGIQLMRDEMFAQMQPTANPGEQLRLTFLESKIKQKDEQIKHLSLLLDQKFMQKASVDTVKSKKSIHDSNQSRFIDKENSHPNIIQKSYAHDKSGQDGNMIFVDASFAGPKKISDSVLAMKGSKDMHKLKESEKKPSSVFGNVNKKEGTVTNSGYFGVTSNAPTDKQSRNRPPKQAHHFYSQCQF